MAVWAASIQCRRADLVIDHALLAAAGPGVCRTTYSPFLAASALLAMIDLSRSSPGRWPACAPRRRGTARRAKASQAIRYQSVTGSNWTSRPTSRPCLRRRSTSSRARSRAVSGRSGWRLAGLGVDLAGEHRPVLGDDAERGAEGADVEVDAADALRRELGGLLARRRAHPALQVVPPDRLLARAGTRSFALAADQQDRAARRRSSWPGAGCARFRCGPARRP